MPAAESGQQTADEYLIIGRIVAAYGIKGWVKVKAFTQSDAGFLDYKDCFIRLHGAKKGQWQATKISQGKMHGKGLVVQFEGVDDRNKAEALLKCDVAVKPDAFPELAEDDYYWYQLEGLQVFVEDQLLGKVSHLLETGSNDVLVVKPCADSIDDKERLLPYRPEVVLQVDLDAGSMLVDWDPDF